MRVRTVLVAFAASCVAISSASTGQTDASKPGTAQTPTEQTKPMTDQMNAAAARAGAAPADSRVFVIDEGTRTLAAVDLSDGSIVSRTTPLVPLPTDVLEAPDGSRLILLNRGMGKNTFRYGFEPSGKSSALLVDSPALRAVGKQIELGWGLHSAVASRDGKRFFVFTAGFLSNKPEESKPAELIAIDIASGEVAGRLNFGRAISNVLTSPAGGTATVLVKPERLEGGGAPPELRFIDLSGPSVLGTLALEGSPQAPLASEDGSVLYLLDPGKPHEKAAKNVNGKLHVVSTEKRALEATLDAGSAPRIWLDDASGQLYLLSNGFGAGGVQGWEGELRVIRGAAVSSRVPAPASPTVLSLSPGGKRLYVAGENLLAIYDRATLKPVGQIPISSLQGIKGFIVSPDERRAFELYVRGLRLAVLDLEGQKLVEWRNIGSFGKRLGKAADAIELATLTVQTSNLRTRAARADLLSQTIIRELSDRPTAPPSLMFLRPDGKFVYVLSYQTGEVTIIDTETAMVVNQLDVGNNAQRMTILPGGDTLAISDGSRVAFVDTKTNTKTGELKHSGRMMGPLLSPDGRYLVVLGKDAVFVLDPATGKQLRRIEGFTKPAQLVFSRVQ